MDTETVQARLHIVRRLLRYRGGQTAWQTAQRYFWSDAEALDILNELVSREEAVESEGVYYHGKLYDRARRQTLKNRCV